MALCIVSVLLPKTDPYAVCVRTHAYTVLCVGKISYLLCISLSLSLSFLPARLKRETVTALVHTRAPRDNVHIPPIRECILTLSIIILFAIMV